MAVNLSTAGAANSLNASPASGPSVATFTIASWIQRTSTANYGTCGYFGTGGGGFYQSGIWHYPTGELNFDLMNSGVGTTATSAAVSLGSANTWYHVAYTYDGATIRGYVNGAPLTLTGSAATGWVAAPVTLLNIGQQGGGSSDTLVQDQSFFSRALTQAEIQTLMRSRDAGRALAGCIAYYPLFNGAVSRLDDWSGHGYTLTVTGTAVDSTAQPPAIGWGPSLNPAIRPATATGISLAGIGSTTSNGSAAIIQAQPLAGTGLTTSNASAGLSVGLALLASGLTTSNGASEIRLAQAFAGSGLTTSNGAAALAVVVAIAGTGTTTSNGAAALIQAQARAGSGLTTSNAAAGLGVGIPLAGSGATTSNGAAELAQLQPLAGTGQTTSNASANVGLGGLDGSGQTISNGAANLSVGLALAGSGLTTSNGSAAIDVLGSLGGTGQTISNASVALGVAIPLAGIATTTSNASAQLATDPTLSGTGLTTSNASAGLTAGLGLVGAGLTTSGGSVGIVLQLNLDASGQTVSNASADVTGGTPPPPVGGSEYSGGYQRRYAEASPRRHIR